MADFIFADKNYLIQFTDKVARKIKRVEVSYIVIFFVEGDKNT